MEVPIRNAKLVIMYIIVYYANASFVCYDYHSDSDEWLGLPHSEFEYATMNTCIHFHWTSFWYSCGVQKLWSNTAGPVQRLCECRYEYEYELSYSYSYRYGKKFNITRSYSEYDICFLLWIEAASRRSSILVLRKSVGWNIVLFEYSIRRAT